MFHRLPKKGGVGMVDYRGYEFIQFERRERILTATLNRPECLNAVNAKLHAELVEMYADFARDEEADVMILTGAGRGFCAGGDIRGGLLGADLEETKEKIFREARALIVNILEVDKPILAAVNGPAAGLGVTLALFCDVVYASERARLGDTHVKIGLVAGDGGAVIWPLLVGVNRAKELLMTGDMLDAGEAYRLGLVNHVVPDNKLMEAVRDRAKQLVSGSTMAIRGTKKAVNAYLKWMVNQVLDLSMLLEKECFDRMLRK
jgi:enoyl-CoA hydratase/carnithine racemase